MERRKSPTPAFFKDPGKENHHLFELEDHETEARLRPDE